MSCGDAANSWVPTLVPSVWSGTVDSDSLVVTFANVSHLTVSLVGAIPGVGTWSKDSSGFHWVVALEGISWSFDVTPEACSVNGDVTAAVGIATDGNSNTHSVTMSRIA